MKLFIWKSVASFQYPEDDIFENLQQEAANADDITKKLRIIDAHTDDIRSLYIQVTQLKDIVFSILSIADKKIMVLVESMQK